MISIILNLFIKGVGLNSIFMLLNSVTLRGYLKVIAQTLFSNSLFQIVDNIYMSCRLTILYNRLKHILNLFGILS